MTTHTPEPVLLEVRPVASGQEVAISGQIDVRSVPDVRLLLHDIVDSGSGELLVDLRAAEIGDATGLGVLVESFVRARRAGRRLAVTDMSPRTERLLRASRLDRALVRRAQEAPSTVAPLTA